MQPGGAAAVSSINALLRQYFGEEQVRVCGASVCAVREIWGQAGASNGSRLSPTHTHIRARAHIPTRSLCPPAWQPAEEEEEEEEEEPMDADI